MYPGKVNENDDIYEFPIIISNNSKGSEIKWQIKISLNIDNCKIQILQEYFDSKYQLPLGCYATYWVNKTNVTSFDTEVTLVTSGKNLGKSNSTNVFTQALFEANSKHNKYFRKNNTVLDYNGVILQYPMLAMQLDKITLDFDNEEFMIQKKYNGTRAMATLDLSNDDIIIYSRDRQIVKSQDHLKYEMKQICIYIEKMLNSTVHLDGEIYKHGKLLEDISGQSRKIKNLENIRDNFITDFIWYDFVAPEKITLSYKERYELMSKAYCSLKCNFVKLAETYKINSSAELEELDEEFLRDGYEGTIIRRNGPYKFSIKSRRSKDLIKMKHFMDSEFKVVDFTNGTNGAARGTLMYICTTPNNEIFRVVLGDNVDEKGKTSMGFNRRQELYRLMDTIEENGKTFFENNIKNRMITIKYLGLTKNGKPNHAQTVGYLPRVETL
jgi:ATP-dependent DNA ligase